MKNRKYRPSFKIEKEISTHLFVNRNGPINKFKEFVLSPPETNPDIPEELRYAADLLIFLGKGGQGKSALADHLYTLARNSDYFENKVEVYPIEIDFKEDKWRDDPEKFLIGIRNLFSRQGISFPVFDIAMLFYMSEFRAGENIPELEKPYYDKIQKAGGVAAEAMAEGGSGLLGGIAESSAESVGRLAVGAVDDIASASVPIVTRILKKVCNKVIDKAKLSTLKSKRDYFDYLVQGNDRLSRDELKKRLPMFLALDLNYGLSKLQQKNTDKLVKAVILLDEYEWLLQSADGKQNLVGAAIDLSVFRFFQALKRSVVCLFSRKSVNWEGWEDYIRASQYPLKGLPRQDAVRLINNADILDERTIEQILENALDDNEDERSFAGYYPLLIDLQLKNISNQKQKGNLITAEMLKLAKGISLNQRKKELVDRLFRDYDKTEQKAIKRLCYCKEFGQNIFNAITSKFSIGLDQNDFKDFSEISLIEKNDNGTFSIIHSIAEIIREDDDPGYRKETFSFLLDYHESLALPQRKSRFTDHELRHLILASDCKLSLTENPRDYSDWLWKNWNIKLKNMGYHTQGLSLWQQAQAYYRDKLEKNPENNRIYKTSIANYMVSLGDQDGALENLKIDSNNKITLSDFEIRSFIDYSPNLESADYWFDKLSSLKVSPGRLKNPHVLTTAINLVLKKVRKREEAQKYLSILKKYKLAPDVYTLPELIRIADNFNDAIKLIEQSKPNILSEFAFSKALEIAKTPDEAGTVINLMDSAKIALDIVQFNIVLSKNNHGEFDDLIEQIKTKHPNLVWTDVTFTILLKQADRWEKVVDIYDKLLSQKIKPDGRFFSTLLSKAECLDHTLFGIREAGRNRLSFQKYHWNHLDKHIETLNDFGKIIQTLKESHQQITSAAFGQALTNVVKHSPSEDRESLYDEVVSIANDANLDVTGAILECFLRNEIMDEVRIKVWQDRMHEAGIKPNPNTMQKIIEVSCDLEHACSWIKYLEERDVSVNAGLFSNICKHADTIADFEMLIDMMIQRGLSPDLGFFERTRQVVANQQEQNQSLLEDYKNWLHQLLDRESINHRFVLDALLLVEDDRSYLKRLVIRLEKMGFTPRPDAIVQIMQKEENFKNTFSWFDYCINNDIKITSMFSNPLILKANTTEQADIIISQFSDYDVFLGEDFIKKAKIILADYVPKEELEVWAQGYLEKTDQ